VTVQLAGYASRYGCFYMPIFFHNILPHVLRPSSKEEKHALYISMALNKYVWD